MTEYRWSKRKSQAAMDVAADELTDTAIAQRAGVSRQSLLMWRRQPEFAARVAEHIATLSDAIESYAIAHRITRVADLDDIRRRLRQVIAERAEDTENQDVAGGSTGLMVRQHKMVGTGRDAELVVEYAVDTALLRELREVEKQAAQEIGQWTEKREVSGKDGVPLAFTIAIARVDNADRDD